MQQQPATIAITIEQLKSRLAAWRKTKKHRDRIPQDIWDDAALLAAELGATRISKTLALDYTKLKALANSRRPQSGLAAPSSALPAQDFIQLNLSSPAFSDCLVEMETSGGDKMKMHFTGRADLDLMELAKTFWSKGP